VTVAELSATADLVDLVSRARDAGEEAMLFERPLPGAAGVVGIGRRFDLVSTSGGVALENAAGEVVDRESGKRLPAAAAVWRRLSERLGPEGLLAIGGFAFDPDTEPGPPWTGFPALLFRVPRVAVTRTGGRVQASGDLALLDRVSGSGGLHAPPAHRFEVDALEGEGAWRERVVAAIGRISHGAAEKVVLAREVVARGDGVLAAGTVLRNLRSRFPACYTYLVGGGDGTALAGSSPELLIRRTNGTAFSQPMAGSIRRGGDALADDDLAARLLASPKEAAEHRLTARHVAEALGPLAKAVTVGSPEVVRLANIQHLATSVEATLTVPPPSLLELANALHPTPAVNGVPASAAAGLIRELEGLERGWYAGAVGWVDGRGDGELAVAIRCGLLWEDGARLYAGAGLLRGSDPDSELAETRLKLEALLRALLAG
jgi:salicylate biosynthesis isochorismate synthase/menaquinone-specific isochorismate synthase